MFVSRREVIMQEKLRIVFFLQKNNHNSEYTGCKLKMG